MKSQIILFLLCWSSYSIACAQESSFTPAKQRIQISSKDGDYETILKLISENVPKLNMDEDSSKKRDGRDLDVKIVYTISEKGKTLYRSEAIPAKISAKADDLELFSNGLEESMINTWEKQGFIRRQVGRVENPDKPTGTLPKPATPGAGKTIISQDGKTGGLSQPGGKVEQQGFIRRQVGRIPKTSYEVNVQIQTPKDRGNSQPSNFLIVII
ncbi:hypothetical protein MM239_10320 [Belliella sp. DSM 111904]|uniref:Uncharacterized protein n=1 Tax=Belliella filtrata TaxID=2923435 RepID=A0ABS9V0A7_9BACT|nr:hypothetical protein [Belliella filtrata]MCH7409789.1 hypothetical protein [Belliella filtrata]